MPNQLSRSMTLRIAWMPILVCGCLLPEVSSDDPRPPYPVARAAMDAGAVMASQTSAQSMDARPAAPEMSGSGTPSLGPGAATPAMMPGEAAPAIPTGAPAAGQPCQEPDALACAGADGYKRIRCESGVWRPHADCPDGEAARCVAPSGSCQYATKSCDANNAQTKTCVGANVHECGGAAGTSTLMQACGGDTPDCLNAECVCLTRCNGQCASLQWDARNCGSCDHDCQGGACVAGSCGPAVLVRDAPTGLWLFVDEKYLYWITKTDLDLMRAPVEGGEPFKLATLDKQVRALLRSDGKHVYLPSWSGTVTQYDVETGEAMVLAAGQVEIRGFAMDADNLYWLRGKNIFNGDPIPPTPYEHNLVKMPKTGGTPVVLATERDLSDLIMHGDYLYYTSAYNLFRISKNGGPPTQLLMADGAQFNLQISGDRIYYYLPVSELFSLPLAGGEPTHLLTLSGIRSKFLVDGQRAYLMESGPVPRLGFYTLTTGSSLTPLCPLPQGTYDFAMNQQFVFLGAENRIYRMPKPLP